MGFSVSVSSSPGMIVEAATERRLSGKSTTRRLGRVLKVTVKLVNTQNKRLLA